MPLLSAFCARQDHHHGGAAGAAGQPLAAAVPAAGGGAEPRGCGQPAGGAGGCGGGCGAAGAAGQGAQLGAVSVFFNKEIVFDVDKPVCELVEACLCLKSFAMLKWLNSRGQAS